MPQNRSHFERRLGQMKTEQQQFRTQWLELADYVAPRSPRFLVDDNTKTGNTRNNKIIDNTATIALRTLASGLMSGVTNPSRPWFQLRTPDRSLSEFGPVKVWLSDAKDRILETFLQSNLYSLLPAVYSDLGLFGTSALVEEEDPRKNVRFHHFPVGSFFLAVDGLGQVGSCYRETKFTVEQMVQKFGRDQVSSRTRSAYDQGNYDQWVYVNHAVEENELQDEGRLESRHLKYRSVYWEVGERENDWLSDRGWHEMPVVAPRWQTVGNDSYGVSPGMDALGDVKGLQVMQKRKLQAIDKMVNPPMVGPTSLRNKKASLLSGDITYVDVAQGGQRFEPAQTVQFPLGELFNELQETRRRINDAFFKDLFLMISQDYRSGITATEIAARQEEKLLALGPVYLKLNDELLDPMINRTFGILLRRGALPPPPPELQGQEITVEYISIMAQTMKAVGVTSLERTFTFAGNMAQAFPEILDKIDADKAIEQYAEMQGVSPVIIRDQKAVDAIRRQKAQAAQAQQAAELAKQGSETARNLGQVNLGDNNAMAQLLQRMGGGGAA